MSAGRDLIRLRGLRVRGNHGVFAAERELGQEFLVDLDLLLDLAPAAASDDVRDTVHYGELAERVAAVVAGEPVQLIEALAQRIADAVFDDQRVRAVRVEVHKPQAPIAIAFDDVSVSLSREAPPVPVVIALGSNLGDRAGLLAAAGAALGETEGIEIGVASPVVETAAVTLDGVDESRPAYLNQVLLARTSLGPRELLGVLLDIERRHGRVREERWGDRTLDLDLIAYGDVESESAELRLPHPRAAEREFVLAPWLAADPDAVLPGRGRVADLLAALRTPTRPGSVR